VVTANASSMLSRSTSTTTRGGGTVPDAEPT